MRTILTLLLIISAEYVMAQDSIPALITDRPDQTESAEVVPLKSLQIETGFVMENSQSNHYKQTSFAYNSTLLRYGLFENMELRLGLEYLGDEIKISAPDSTNTTSGLSPLNLGFKIKIQSENGWQPAIALLGALVMPFTASANYKPRYTATNMRFSFAHTLSQSVSLGYNLGVEFDGETPNPSYFYSASLGIGITEKTGAFIESYGLLKERGKPSHLADAGLTYLIRQNLQIDVSGGFGIENGADNFISFGITYRLPQ